MTAIGELIPIVPDTEWVLNIIQILSPAIERLLADMIDKIPTGVIANSWAKGKCRIEQGVFFVDDRMVLLIESAAGRYLTQETDLADALARDPDHWFDFDAANTQQTGTSRITFGVGSYEGEGFLAFEFEDKLQWILHLIDKEQFVSAKIEGDRIYASSSEYPNFYSWTIPIKYPEKLSFGRATTK